jgi:hypothetical protein
MAVAAALTEYLSPKVSVPPLQTELAELVERLRHLINLVYPGGSYPHELRETLRKIHLTLVSLEKSSEDERARLQEEAGGQVELLLRYLREHSRQRQQELHENARRFADLEHTAGRLAITLQEEDVRSKALLERGTQ